MKPWRLLIPVAALLLLLGVFLGRRAGTHGRPGFATPEDCVLAHAVACKEGDSAAYLDCLAGPLLEEARRLEQTARCPRRCGVR